MRGRSFVLVLFLFAAAPVFGTIFGTVQGVVHDPQHRPITGAAVTLKAQLSDWKQTEQTRDDGSFDFTAVPVGAYTVTVSKEQFRDQQQSVIVTSGSSPVLHFPLALTGVKETAVVYSDPVAGRTDSVTPTTLISREDVESAPGADRTNSLAIITNNVPGAYLTHDQLHIRGGHQVNWLIDGVPVPNTNIASNVGPQFDPKDIDYLEVQRGSYDAGYGDRTYGIFNVVPRTGFERDNEAELITSFGNFYQTNDQINFGGHTQRFAYYASLSGNRSNLGLETPDAPVIHDAENGFGGFSSFIFNVNPSNQLRFVTSLRRDFYQIPNTPANQAAGIRDVEHEADSFVNFSWVRTFSPRVLLTVSPFYHFNSANYDGGPNDFPISTTDHRSSNYVGSQTTLGVNVKRNSLEAGFYGFWQRDNQLFGLVFNDASHPNFQDREIVSGNLEAFFVEDKLKLTSWLTVSGGVRQTHFSGSIAENATSPRAGFSVRVPKINVVFHGFYGKFYQAPPLVTASGPLLEFVTSQSLGFIPLRGERDEEYQFGVTIPLRGWFLDADNFHTRASNFFDHNNVGNSNIFFPLTIDEGLIQGWELTLRSPKLWRRAQVHLAYSNQLAEGRGAISGGLTDFSPPSDFFLLDHDQRNTLSIGFDFTLPWKSFVSGNIAYGSGFANGNPPPDHLPGHTTLDLSLGKSFGEKLRISMNALNVTNRHLLIDNSLTFGGTHFDNPREIFAEVRWRFSY